MPLQPRPDDACWEAYEAAIDAAFDAYTDASAAAALKFLADRAQCTIGTPGDACRLTALGVYNASLNAASAALNAALEAAIAAFLSCEGVTTPP